MKVKKLCSILLALVLAFMLLLYGCTSQEESQAAVSDAVLQAFALQEEEAVEKLGRRPYNDREEQPYLQRELYLVRDRDGYGICL